MNTEYEIRVLEIDKNELESKLLDLGAVKENDYFQRRYVYDVKPKCNGKWIRLRTNGNETTLTFKCITNASISGTKELEIEVGDFEKCNLLLNQLGYFSKSYQENKRCRYRLGDITFDIDSWPFIPTYVEIEGNSEKAVFSALKKLGYTEDEVTTLDVDSIYKKYGFDLDKIKKLEFEED